MINERQKKLFATYEALEEKGVCLFEELKRNRALRVRAKRCLDSIHNLSKYKSSLFMYGYIELVDLFNENKTYSKIDKDLESRDLLEWIAEDIIENDFERPFSYYAKNVSRAESALRRFYKNTEEFYKDYGIFPELIYYNSGKSTSLFLFYLGNKFESLVREYIYPNAPYQVVYKDCIPDFIIDGRWTDIKLSKSTVFLPMDSTINKYLKYVDKLTIIYALEDEVPDDFYEDYGFIELISIESFYGSLPSYAVSELEELKRSASEFKEAIR